MLSNKKSHRKGKVFQKGQIVIPAELRKQYNIHIGDQVDFVLSNEGILLKPASKYDRKKTSAESLFGISSNHKNIANKLSKKDIRKATEEGFTKGWNK
jgi:AbrB family looped-hinge helix DNA binding protein